MPGLAPKLLRTPLVVGANAVTDRTGVARYRRLALALGVPGAYVATATVAARLATAG